jgi:hypothetical protein
VNFAALVPIGLFSVILTCVGVRLIALARRTRELPEFALGSGLMLIAFVGLPLSALGRIPALVGSTLGHVVFAMGIFFVAWGIANLYLFTWRVFRRGETWASAFAIGCGVALLVSSTAIAYEGSQGNTLAEILPRTRPWSLAIMGMVLLHFAWSGLESLRYYRLLRRRMLLGLADPVVVNRFLLWGVSSLTAVGLCAGLALCAVAKLTILRDPIPLSLMAVAGCVKSLSWTLTFFPPQAYLARLRRSTA